MLKPGQLLYDNDRRYLGRKIEVLRVEGTYVICKSGPLQVRVRLDRIFADEQPRRSGYTLRPVDGAPSANLPLDLAFGHQK